MCCQLSKVYEFEITKYLSVLSQKLWFNDSIVTSTEILDDSDLNNLNNTFYKVTKLGLVVKVHVRNGLPTLKTLNVLK